MSFFGFFIERNMNLGETLRKGAGKFYFVGNMHILYSTLNIRFFGTTPKLDSV